MKTTNLVKSVIVCLVLVTGFGISSAQPRERLLMDFGWRFHLGNEWGLAHSLAKAGTGSGPGSRDFSDASWRPVQLPHDWAVELPFDERADGSHGFKALGAGFPSNSVAWYRRTFELPQEDSGKRLWLEFDGVYRNCDVFVNGWLVGHHDSGYSSFRFDITDVANCGGKNLVAVKVDATQTEGWFYEGAGIYRHVWLVKTGPVAITPDGIFVFSEFEKNPAKGGAEVHTLARLMNRRNTAVRVRLNFEIIAPDGKPVGRTSQPMEMAPGSMPKLESVFYLCPTNSVIRVLQSEHDLAVQYEPELWSPESPKLYKLLTSVELDGRVVDRQETEFGIRSVAFDTDKGFFLNGKPYVIKGTCNHQDHAGVGSAIPDRLQYFRVAKLKEMGGNAYRCAHNPPTPELLEACDRLGMLVLDENRLLGSGAQNLELLEQLVVRDRNHPCVFAWSIANEEFSRQGMADGGRVAATMQALVKRLDPTRPVTYAANLGNTFEGINSVIEVRGWNYHIGQDVDDYHKAHPAQPNVGTEQGSTVSTRGIYANDKVRGYVSAYDENAPSWAHTAETWWSFFFERPWLSGAFVWTGFDYRGEPTPYSWPCINSHFGILDTCGFPKDNFWYYQSWWTDKPVLHLLPHWNWPGKEGQEVDVRALSNCEDVEVFLNGKSQGRQAIKRNSTGKWKIAYSAGVLSAKGFARGKLVAEAKAETTGAPASVHLATDRLSLNADGEDVSVVTVSVVDAEGRIVPTATNSIQFEVSGHGRILGVGNGDPSCHEPDVFLPSWPTHSRSVEGWRWKQLAAVGDAYKSSFVETAEQFDDSAWTPVDVNTASGPLEGNEGGIFRATLNVTEQELAAESLELCFGRIDQDGFVFVNGQRLGESHDPDSSAAFDVKSLVHPGANSVAIVVANWDNVGGVNNGVSVRMQERPTKPVWQRSVFNGLAQIIVQAPVMPGEIKLVASSTGLASGDITITSQLGERRAALP